MTILQSDGDCLISDRHAEGNFSFAFDHPYLRNFSHGVIVLLVAVVQSPRHLRSVQRELHQANEQVSQSQTAAVDLEKSAAKLKTELEAANTKAEQWQNELETAQSQLKEQERHEQELTTELEKARKEAEEQLAAEREASERKFEALTKSADDAISKLSESEKRVAELSLGLLTTASAEECKIEGQRHYFDQSYLIIEGSTESEV